MQHYIKAFSSWHLTHILNVITMIRIHNMSKSEEISREKSVDT